MTTMFPGHRATTREFGNDWERSPVGLYMPPRVKRHYDRPVAVDLFAGAGGMGCGFHQAGFHVAAASEFWHTAAMTYMINLARPGVKIHFDTPEREAEFGAVVEKRLGLGPGGDLIHSDQEMGPNIAGSGWIAHQPADHPGCEHFFLYDIRNLTGEAILDALGLEQGDVAVVAGGPPCQGFSAAGRKDVMDPRNSLVFEYARLITEIMPRTFVMENVPGILSMVTPEGIPVVDAFCQILEDGSYGEYNALRKSMVSMTDARAGARGKKRSSTDHPDNEPLRRPSRKTKKHAGTAEPDQLDLFGAAS